MSSLIDLEFAIRFLNGMPYSVWNFQLNLVLYAKV
jgi:hypothetical protein